MFEPAFAMLFRAIDRIKSQLEHADAELRVVLADELTCLRRLGDQYMDNWISLDEHIDAILDHYDLRNTPYTSAVGVKKAALGPTVNPPDAPFRLPRNAHDPSLQTLFEPFAKPLEPANLSADTASGQLDTTLQSLAFAVPESAVDAFRQGLGYYDLLMFEDASKALERAIELADHPIARLYLAAAHTAKGRFAEGLSQVMQVRSAADNTILRCATYEVEAQIRLAEEDVEAAIGCLQTIVAQMPDYHDVWYNLGICFAQQGRYNEAADALQRVANHDPNDVTAATALIRVELERNHVAEAARVCDAAMQHAPRHIHLLLAKSYVLERQARSMEAAALLRDMTRQHPLEAGAWRRLAWLLLQQGLHEEAAAVLKKQLSLAPHHKQALMQLGIVELLTGRLDRAEAILSDVMVDGLDKPVVWIALGQISWQRGDDGKAYARFLRAMRDPRAPIRRLAFYCYGVLLLDRNEPHESEKYLKAAANLGPSNPAILIALARAAEQLGRSAEASTLRSQAGRADSV